MLSLNNFQLFTNFIILKFDKRMYVLILLLCSNYNYCFKWTVSINLTSDYSCTYFSHLGIKRSDLLLNMLLYREMWEIARYTHSCVYSKSECEIKRVEINILK